VDLVWFGSQAFTQASSFNADIGAWNTASVTTLKMVCAAFGQRLATAADALGRSLMPHGRRARWHC
jgi:surface protein